MPKVFRIHDTGPTHEDWFPSQEMGSKVIEDIKVQDTAGKKQPTSIPSPFARMDLVRTAFETVSTADTSGKVDLDKTSDAHKLVSDALDIGQIFFNLQRHTEKLKVVRWNKELEIEQLVNSNNKGHQHLGNTLDLFLRQDAGQYNFDMVDDLFILKYNHKVIGGTSPSTLFFAAARADEMNVDIQFGNDVMLDPKILPLYKREDDYVRYLFSMQKNINGFSEAFKEVTKYLKASLEALEKHNPDLYDLVHNDKGQFYEQLEEQHLPADIGVPISVLNNLRLKNAGVSSFQSDFQILSDKYDGVPPLVLPSGTFSKKWKYTSAPWDQSTDVPQEPSIPLESRKLPGLSQVYPFLSESDFLSDTLVKLPYNIDEDKFKCFGASNFLIPIKPIFFDFFNAEELGKKVKLEIKETGFGGLATVHLAIPTTKGLIEFKKTYEPKRVGAPVSTDNRGSITTIQVNLAITPFIKVSTAPIDYTVGILNTDEHISHLKVTPKRGIDAAMAAIETVSQRRTNKPTGFVQITEYFSFKEDFDYLELQIDDNTCLCFPKLKIPTNGAKQFRFALDFGTTNTHIEYTTNENPVGFNIEERDTQIVFLKDLRKVANKELNDGQKMLRNGLDLMSQELFPNIIKKGNVYQFPIRTCLLENQTIDHETSVKLFNDLNIGFDFGNRFINNHLNYETTLKWSDVKEQKNRIRIKYFFIELLTLCKNKVLLNDGDLDKTQFVWFYPVSMIGHQLLGMRAVWKEAFEYVFANTGLSSERNLTEHSESIAPFYYYHEKKGISAYTAPALSIDIGGGTADLVAFEKGKPSLISSFQFAGNAIFGDGLNKDQSMNGFLRKYLGEFERLISNPKNQLDSSNDVFGQLKSKGGNSTDLINYFFSLESHPDVVNRNLPISLSGSLNQDQDFKILFVVYYSALFYHVAQILKEKGIAPPSDILFSGNGSKSIFILNSGEQKNWDATQNLVNAVFNEVYGVNDTNVRVEIDDNPKEVTTKGGLFVRPEEDKLKNIVCTHLGGLNDLGTHNIFDFSQSHYSYDDIKEQHFVDIEANIDNYFDTLDAINSKLSFSKEFGVSQVGMKALTDVKTDKRAIKDYLRLGLKQRELLANSAKEPIEETLFFYPFVGMLNDLALKVSES